MCNIENEAIRKIKKLFEENRGTFTYESQRGNTVNCKAIEDGVTVDCLNDAGYKNFLPWGVFWHAVHVMSINGGGAPRGDAVSGRLGSDELPFHSVEGHIANTVYGKQCGDSVFRRISPVAHILIAAGVCEPQRGDMQLAT